MSQLEYDGQLWVGVLHTEQELFSVMMTEQTFQKHLRVYLERKGIPTTSYDELVEEARIVLHQRSHAAQILREVEYWQKCEDPDVYIFRRSISPEAEHEPMPGAGESEAT